MENQSETNTGSTTQKKGLFHIGLAVLLAVAMFFSGLHLGSLGVNGSGQSASIFSIFSNTEKSQAAEEPANLSEFWRVWELMEEKFASASSSSQLSAEERVRGAIRGLVDSYEDPYTSYLPPSDAAVFEEDISGNFSGVGMEVGLRDDVITIISPLPETPAENAGLLAGDVIVAIDGKSTEKMDIDDAVRLIRGEAGTDVELRIYREGESDFLEIVVTRDEIAIPTIKTETRGDVFIITLYSFNAQAELRTQLALREFVESGLSKLVFDLRGNPGGFLQSAINISSFFLPTGKVVVNEVFGEGENTQVYRSSGKTVADFTPDDLVVLIDRGSASASEIVAGALTQHHVATLMGGRSFGKGSVQELVELSSGASLKVTVARWVTPDGTSISENGLEPDYVVERTVEDRQADVDPQLEAALEFLAGTYQPESTEQEGE